MMENAHLMGRILASMLASFESDPADTDYQRGYKAALEEVQKCWAELEGID